MNARPGVIALVVVALAAGLPGPSPRGIARAQSAAVTRLPQNPLITVNTSPSLGTNVNGATVIRVPTWIERPLGRYYMYFANHMGTFIRLAYADAVTGPWKVYEPGVLDVSATAFFRPQPDPVETLDNFYTHVASPEIAIDASGRHLRMWVHGWWTNGERWPAEPRAAAAWARQHDYGQFTQAAESSDGLHFEMHAPITRASYLRVFDYDGMTYGMARLGRLARSADPLGSFELGPNPFQDDPSATRVRHVTLLKRDNRLIVFFTVIGDAPEHVLMTTIDLKGDWTTWRTTRAVPVLQPEAPYECVDLPNAPSDAGDVETPVRQIRDPFIFEDGGKTYLFYSICGEQGIAAAEIDLRR